VRELETSRAFLVDWLLNAAYPLWSRNGIDSATGGFIEALDQRGVALDWPRRARVHPRQVYAFAEGLKLGWRGAATSIVERGFDYFIKHYRRPDGLFLTLVDASGVGRDARALLYDQAFVLLAYAAATTALGSRELWEGRALELRLLIDQRLRAADGGYCSEEGAGGYESNPHMHLLEAYLAWADISSERGWKAGVHSLVNLALTRFIRQQSGAIPENYSAAWVPMAGESGRVEPGHQYEWAWLLLRAGQCLSLPLHGQARRLIDVGEQHGLHQGFVVNALLNDLTVHDARARLWPQCERLKATLLAASQTTEQGYWHAAQEAAKSLRDYLHTPMPGLWFDVRSAGGEMQDGASPASTLYHLVSAIVALDSAVRMRA
jgi:mannose/cellobiose epimerase-like protein (N-acyl-D-glucosamine 2-epimerase family)